MCLLCGFAKIYVCTVCRVELETRYAWVTNLFVGAMKASSSSQMHSALLPPQQQEHPLLCSPQHQQHVQVSRQHQVLQPSRQQSSPHQSQQQQTKCNSHPAGYTQQPRLLFRDIGDRNYEFLSHVGSGQLLVLLYWLFTNSLPHTHTPLLLSSPTPPHYQEVVQRIECVVLFIVTCCSWYFHPDTSDFSKRTLSGMTNAL